MQQHNTTNASQFQFKTIWSHTLQSFSYLALKKSISKIHLISQTLVYHALSTKQPSCTAIIKIVKLKVSTTQRKLYHSKSVTDHACNINCHYIHVTQMQSLHIQYVYNHRIIVNIQVHAWYNAAHRCV